ncbi:unnamed protein product [Closterium sp. Naga37s-1]|nr:unnamed protein product [Closterium sp. Naga37s-1]
MSPRPSPDGDPPQPRTGLTSPVAPAFAGGLNASSDAFFNVTFSSSGAAAGPSWSAPRRADRVGKGAKGGPENALHGFRGVRQRSWGKWVAEIRAPRSKKRIWLGSFADARTAALTYDRAARKLYGTRAQLNFFDEAAVSAPSSSHPHGASLHGADARSGLISSGSGSGGSASDSEGGASAGVIACGERTSRSVETPAPVPRCASSDDATPPSLARFPFTSVAPLLTRDSNPAESAVSAAMAAGSRHASFNTGTLAAARCDYIGALPLPSMTFLEIFNRSCPPLTAPAGASTSVSALSARGPSAEKRGMWQGPVESFRAPAASSAGRVDPSAESGKAVISRELTRGVKEMEESVACSGWSHGGGVANHSIVNWNQKNQDCYPGQGVFAVGGNEGANMHFPPCPTVLPAQLSQQPALTVRGGLVPYGSIFASPPVMSVGGMQAPGMAVPWGCGGAVPWVQERAMAQQGAMVQALRESRAQLVREQIGSSGSAGVAGNAWSAGATGLAENAGAGVWGGRGTNGADAVHAGGAGMEHGVQERAMEQQGAMVQALRESRAQLVREQMGSIGSAVTAGNAWSAGTAGAGVWSCRGTDGADAVQGGGAGMEHGVEHGVLDAAAIERMLQLSEALLGPEDPPPHGPHIPHGHRDPHPHGANAPRGRVVHHASDAAALEGASALLAYGDYQCLTTALPDAMASSEPTAVPHSLHVSLPGSVPHAAAAVAACEPACRLADLILFRSPLCMGGELTVPGSHCMLPPAVCMAPSAAVPWVQERTMVQQGAMTLDRVMVQALRESRAQLVREHMGVSVGAVTHGNAWAAGTAGTVGKAGAGVWSGRSTDEADAVHAGGAGMEYGVLDDAAACETSAVTSKISSKLLG